ncbi:MAG: TnsD family transposase [Fermentimonas sp.]|nr:TnsD family transposase [Fermentimonas sp.]
MLSFFLTPYEDELLYSVIARYHFAVGNSDFRDTLEEIFGTRNKVPSIYFPSGIASLSARLPESVSLTPENLINKHTLFPLYKPFLPQERANTIFNQMIFEKGNGVYAAIGMAAGSICARDTLVYCPQCVKDDMKNYGESYFRRSHNTQGVFVCFKHGCLLKEYDASYKTTSRLEFIRLDSQRAEIDTEEYPDYYGKDFIKVAWSINYLLNNPVIYMNQGMVRAKYLNLLDNKGFLTCSKRIKQQELLQAFRAHYCNDFLSYMQSEIYDYDENSWIKSITRKPRKTVHPIRHILFINFLMGGIEEFFSLEQTTKPEFGNPPWYCLNPAADHYLKPVIYDCVITPDYKSNEPVGTFSCQCGFVYSRKGPDKNIENKFKIGRIKQFGTVWESKLESLIMEGKHTLRQLGREMKCDPKTIVKYATKLGMEAYLNSTMKFDDIVTKNHDYDNKASEYCKDVLEFMISYPDCSRTAIRQALPKQYRWLNRNKPEWLEENLPPKIRRGNVGVQKGRVNWEIRDTTILFLLKSAYTELIQLPKPVRITRSLLAKRINKSALIEQHFNKLPRTNRYLEQITETIVEFQKRRINTVSMDLFLDKGEMNEWEIIRKAGIRPEFISGVMPRIEENIDFFAGISNMPADIHFDDSLLY